MKIIVYASVLCLALTGCPKTEERAAAAPLVVDKEYCVANAVGAQAAASQAAELQTYKQKAVVGGGTTAGCGMIMVATAWFDAGTSTLICMAVGAATVAAVPPVEDNGMAAEEAYKRYRDPRCHELEASAEAAG